MSRAHVNGCDFEAKETAAKEWVEKHPGHCPKCMGRGCHTFYESHGLPGPQEEIIDPCDCVLGGHCPRCSGPISEDTPAPCPACGWNYGNNADDTCPDVECFCDVAPRSDYL